MDEVTLEQQIAEVERELKIREVVYPRWINAAKPKLRPETADRQMARMRAVLNTLKKLSTSRLSVNTTERQ